MRKEYLTYEEIASNYKLWASSLEMCEEEFDAMNFEERYALLEFCHGPESVAISNHMRRFSNFSDATYEDENDN